MRKPQAYARISVTLPRDVLAEADRIAAELGRSRSWVLAEGVRKLAVDPRHPEQSSSRKAPLLKGPATLPYGAQASGLGEYRLAQLQSDMRMGPEDRVRASEEMTRLSEMLYPGRPDQLLSFARYEDYLAWDFRSRIRP